MPIDGSSQHGLVRTAKVIISCTQPSPPISQHICVYNSILVSQHEHDRESTVTIKVIFRERALDSGWLALRKHRAGESPPWTDAGGINSWRSKKSPALPKGSS